MEQGKDKKDGRRRRVLHVVRYNIQTDTVWKWSWLATTTIGYGAVASAAVPQLSEFGSYSH